MRVEKNNDFVEITGGLSVNDDGNQIWFIESSLDFKNLPSAFRKRILKSDDEGLRQLKESVLLWADRAGFVRI